MLYGPSLVGQKVLLPLDILTLPGAYLPRASVVPPATPHNYVLADLVCLGEPGRRFLADEFRAGRYAGWNPYQFAGASPTAPRFSPFTVLLCSLRSPVIIAWAQLLVAEIAGIGFYLFCRRTMEIGFWPAAIAGWCYPLTGYFILWQGYGIPYTVCWLPWLLMAVDAVVRGGTRWALAAMMLFTALAVVSGQTDVAGQVLLTSGLFAVGRLAELNWLNVVRRSASQFTTRSVVPHQELRRREHGTVPFGRKGTGTFLGLGAWTQRNDPTGRKMSQSPAAFAGRVVRSALVLAVGWSVGLLLAAPHLVPLLEYTRTGARMDRRSKGEEERPPIGLAALPQVVIPHIYGSTEKDYFDASPREQGSLLESSAATYTGLLATLLAAPLAFCSRRHRLLNCSWILLASWG